MIEYTQQDLDRFAPNEDILPKLHAAITQGDEHAERELMKQLILPAVSLLAAKQDAGPEWIVEQGWNLSEAERVFGTDWLERDNDDLAKQLYA